MNSWTRWIGRRLRSLVPIFALFCFAIVFSVGAAELVLRLFPRLMPEEAQIRIHWSEIVEDKTRSVADPYIGFLYPPHQKGEIKRGSDFGFTYTTDEHGFRNPSPWPARADIVLVGDSMTFGYGVGDDQAWAQLLADHLHRSRVINLGLIGAAPQQYFRIYETFGVPLRPKVVLFGLFPASDLYDASRFDQWLKAGAPGNYDVWRFFGGAVPGQSRGLLDIFEPRYLTAFLREVQRRRHSLLEGQTLTFLDGGRLQLATGLFASHLARAKPDHPSFRLVLETIEQTYRLAQSNDASLLVLLYPTKEEVYLPLLGGPAPETIPPFLNALDERRIPYLDLTARFQSHARNGERLYFEIDGHPNVDGYRLIADVVLEHLKHSAKEYGLRDWD